MKALEASKDWTESDWAKERREHLLDCVMHNAGAFSHDQIVEWEKELVGLGGSIPRPMVNLPNPPLSDAKKD